MRYFVDVMTGVPSIVFGLFIYIVLVVAQVGGSCVRRLEGLARAVAADAADRHPLRRGRAAARAGQPARGGAGARRAAVARRDPGRAADGALRACVTGSLLAVARGMGETAPLLFTVSVAFGLTGNLNGAMNTLPAQIYGDITNPRSVVVTRAWGAALTLVALILILNVVARLIARRSRVA